MVILKERQRRLIFLAQAIALLLLWSVLLFIGPLPNQNMKYAFNSIGNQLHTNLYQTLSILTPASLFMKSSRNFNLGYKNEYELPIHPQLYYNIIIRNNCENNGCPDETTKHCFIALTHYSSGFHHSLYLEFHKHHNISGIDQIYKTKCSHIQSINARDWGAGNFSKHIQKSSYDDDYFLKIKFT